MRKSTNLLFGGATALKSVDVLKHAGSPTALAGDVQGFVGIGIAGGFANAAMEMSFPKKRRKRK